MPKCYDCKKEQPVLYSVVKRGEKMGFALCKECVNVELRKQGKPEIRGDIDATHRVEAH